MTGRLYLDAQHGLCNRLRAMASGAAIAQATGRDLVVVWVPDAHCNALLSDLIDYSGPVLEDLDAAIAARQSAAQVISYMETEPDAAFKAPVLEHPVAGDVYVRSAYTLQSPHRTMAAEQRFLRALRPTRAVQDLVMQVPHPSQIALHIRMGTGPGFDHLPWESPDNWPAARHAELVAWRDKSHLRHFLTHLDAIEAKTPIQSLFLAADLPETYAVFKDRYGDRLRALSRDLYGRSARQLQYALADLLLLTAAPRFLASSWSSFSDVAQRLAHPGRKVERSGHEF